MTRRNQPAINMTKVRLAQRKRLSLAGSQPEVERRFKSLTMQILNERASFES